MPWPAVTGLDRVVLHGVQASRTKTHTHHYTDPVWDLEPQAPGTDNMFDQVAAEAMYTEHTLRVL